MINDLPDKSTDVVTPCFSLSKNDSYLISASGRMVILFNMVVFKVTLENSWFVLSKNRSTDHITMCRK